MTTFWAGGMTDAQEAEAKAICEFLSICYPGHPWGVNVMEGGVHIQYLDRPFNQPYGMFLRVSEADYSASAFKKKLIILAGEWLERSGMRRGARDLEQDIEKVEGVPDKHYRGGVEAVELTPGEIRDEALPIR